MEVPINSEKGTPGVITTVSTVPKYEYSDSILLSLRDNIRSEKRPQYLDNPKFVGVLRTHNRDERTPRKEEDSKNVLTAQRRSFNMGCQMPNVTTEPEQPVIPNTQRVISDRPRSSNGTYGRYGSGRILNRDVSWDYKPSDKNETENEQQFYANSGYVRFRDFRERSNSHNERFYDRRANFRDLERDKNISGTNPQRPKKFFDSEPHQFNHYHDRRRTVSDNEPEWFSSGPTSKNDVIELHGFDDEGKKEGEEFKEQFNQKYALAASRRNSLNNSVNQDDNNNNPIKADVGSSRKDGQFNFDEFINWENPSNQMFDNENNCLRSVGSRFTQYFRNDKFTRGKQDQFEIRRQHDLNKSSTSLCAFLSQGNFQNIENQSNKQSAAASQNAQKKILSVDELERRMRQAELIDGAKKSPRKIIGNNQKQQDTFKKLLSQMNDQHSAEILANNAHHFQQFVGNNPCQKPAIGRQAPTGAEMTNLLQKQTEILKRPDAQTYLQALTRGDVSRQTLYQHASNPLIGKDQRDVIINVLNAFNSLTSVVSSNYGQNSRPVIPDPHHYYAYQNQYQKTFTGPNGMQQRLPTVQELKFYADTIKQNVLIKQQLEEERERERIRKQPEKVASTHL